MATKPISLNSPDINYILFEKTTYYFENLSPKSLEMLPHQFLSDFDTFLVLSHIFEADWVKVKDFESLLMQQNKIKISFSDIESTFSVLFIDSTVW